MRPFVFVTLCAALITVGCGKKGSATVSEASLPELNRAVSAVTMKNGGTFPGTNEVAEFLSASGKTFPTPPPGQKLVFDHGQAVFVR